MCGQKSICGTVTYYSLHCKMFFVCLFVFVFLLSFYVLWGKLRKWRMNTKEQGEMSGIGVHDVKLWIVSPNPSHVHTWWIHSHTHKKKRKILRIWSLSQQVKKVPMKAWYLSLVSRIHSGTQESTHESCPLISTNVPNVCMLWNTCSHIGRHVHMLIHKQ